MRLRILSSAGHVGVDGLVLFNEGFEFMAQQCCASSWVS